jgi:hypothetical protein
VKGTKTFWPTSDFSPTVVAEMPIHLAPNPTAYCKVCGRAGPVELHHFAPVAIFGHDIANTWPTAELCGDCHREWHRLVWPGPRE